MDQPNLLTDIPEGTRSPSEAEWEMLRIKSENELKSKIFKPTRTLEQEWGIESGGQS
jgi:hypothetical protein